MRFECYTDWAQLPESANALFAQAEKNSIFFSRAWFECLTTAILDEELSLLLACVLNKEKVVAILPLMQSKTYTWYALKHAYSPIYSLLIADHDQEQILTCMAQAVSQLSINGILLEPVAGEDNNLLELQKSLEAVGFVCDYTFRSYNWVNHLEARSYNEYMADRPAHLRNTIARKSRKLEREHGYQIRLFTGDDVLSNLADYYAVYDASWKQNELNNADLSHCFIARFTAAGWCRLAILYIKEQPVAAQLWFVCHGKASIFRLAYDKAWRPYSVGSILTSFLMKYVIETDKVKEIDFLSGNESYKQEWMSLRRKRYVLGCIKKVKTASWYRHFFAKWREFSFKFAR